VPNLVARPLSAKALADLIDRKPHLLRPLAAQLLPPPLASTNPAKHLGIGLSLLRTDEDVRQALSAVLRPLRAARARPPRPRASRGGRVPASARSGAHTPSGSDETNGGFRFRSTRPTILLYNDPVRTG
jgi:hypothetical protein